VPSLPCYLIHSVSFSIAWFTVVGLTELIIKMFPPFPIPGFVPDFNAFQLGQNDSWYDMQKFMAQLPQYAVAMVSEYIDVPRNGHYNDMCNSGRAVLINSILAGPVIHVCTV